MRYCLSLLLFFSFAKTFSQSYEAPRYEDGLHAYLRKYAHLQNMLPRETDYIETYRFNVLVSKDGKPKFVNVLGKDLDIRTELKRLIKLSDKWHPGHYNNIPIDTFYSDSILICFLPNSTEGCPGADANKAITYYRVSLSALLDAPALDRNLEKSSIEHFNTGLSLFNNKNYEGAFQEYEKAYNQKYRPLKDALYMMGASLLYMNETARACPFFLEAARYGDSDGDKVYNEKCKGKYDQQALGSNGKDSSNILFGRRSTKLTPAKHPGETGMGTVIIWVDKRGDVVKAQIDSTRTTSLKKSFVDNCLKAAKESKFNPIEADTIARGSIKYIFSVEREYQEE